MAERLLYNIKFAASKESKILPEGARNSRGSCRAHDINRALRVATILTDELSLENFEDLITAALFHDLLSNTDTTVEEISEQSNENVAKIVLEVTDDKNLNKMDKFKTRMQEAPNKSTEATLIILADILDRLHMLSRGEFPDGLTEETIDGYHCWVIKMIWKLPIGNSIWSNDMVILCLKEKCHELCEPYINGNLNHFYGYMAPWGTLEYDSVH